VFNAAIFLGALHPSPFNNKKQDYGKLLGLPLVGALFGTIGGR
jgi:hypothetical protein